MDRRSCISGIIISPPTRDCAAIRARLARRSSRAVRAAAAPADPSFAIGCSGLRTTNATIRTPSSPLPTITPSSASSMASSRTRSTDIGSTSVSMAAPATASTCSSGIRCDRNETITPAANVGLPSNWQSIRNTASQVQAGLTSIVTASLVNDLRVSFSQLDGAIDPIAATDCRDPVDCVGAGATARESVRCAAVSLRLAFQRPVRSSATHVAGRQQPHVAARQSLRAGGRCVGALCTARVVAVSRTRGDPALGTDESADAGVPDDVRRAAAESPDGRRAAADVRRDHAIAAAQLHHRDWRPCAAWSVQSRSGLA